MNKAILNDRLMRLISRFGQNAMEGRQVARRLDALLPQRLRELKSEHGCTVRARRESSGGRESVQSRAERLALTDPRYLAHLEELAAIQSEAVAARVQYETHVMLFEARRSLRLVKR
jgi:hypothetical protein